MSLWSRMRNAFTGDRLNRELTEEYESHIAEAIASGRDPEEARRAFGPLLRHREASRQSRVLGWLESLRMDLLFGCRQLKRNKVTSAAAILSLGLAMGSCVGAFRLIDALLWRPLPIAHPERLHALWYSVFDFDGKLREFHSWADADFLNIQRAMRGRADLVAVSSVRPTDLTYSSDEAMEKANVQYVSGSLFGLFGLQPAAGRLLSDSDDHLPAGSPSAVLSYSYWTHRFGRDPKAVGTSIRIGNQLVSIVGVVDKPFTGTETGMPTDVFVPVTLSGEEGTNPNMSWLRTMILVDPGTPLAPIEQQIETLHHNFDRDRAKGLPDIPKAMLDLQMKTKVFMRPASAGYSELQTQYRRALGAVGILVILVLFIACVNVANLMTAQAAARAQEMALRVSIGAGRLRPVQLVLAESVLLAISSAFVGGAFAWWSAPFVMSRIRTAGTPVQLVLPADWRVAFFTAALVVAVMLLFGLLPALRASSVRPVSALKGGDDPHARKRLMHGMIAAQVAFCFLIVFFAGIFVTSFQRLSNRPLGFDPGHVVLAETISAKPLPDPVWYAISQSLRSVPGVENEALCGRALLEGGSWSQFISIHGAAISATPTHIVTPAPGWLQTMKIDLLRGRDLQSSDLRPGAALVNETFAKTFFPAQDALGQYYETGGGHYRIVGIVRDVAYQSLRESALPIAFIPFRGETQGKPDEDDGGVFTFRIRADVSVEAIAPINRKAVAQAHAGFRVGNLRTQQELIDAQTVRERLLAMLAFFFAGVALLLAGIGLFGVLNYTVLQRRREIGIRIAVGARRAGIAGLVARPIFSMIVLGAAIGLTTGIFAAHSIETLFYATKATDAGILTLPAAAILSVAVLAVIPAIRRAVRTDPAEILRAE